MKCLVLDEELVIQLFRAVVHASVLAHTLFIYDGSSRLLALNIIMTIGKGN